MLTVKPCRYDSGQPDCGLTERKFVPAAEIDAALTWIEELRAGAAMCELIPGISQWALLH